MLATPLMPPDAAPSPSRIPVPPRIRGDSPAALEAGVPQAPTVVARLIPPPESQPELLPGLDALQQANSLYWKLNAQVLSQARERLEFAALRASAAVQDRGRLHAVVAEPARTPAAPPEDAA